MAEPVWKRFGRFSGPTIIGTDLVPPPTGSNSLARWHWLTCRVETGATYGTVVMFDGTGITAGPDQFILVYPAELANEDFNAADDQGVLGKLVARLLQVDTPDMRPKAAALKSALTGQGWYLSPIGELRFTMATSITVARRTMFVNRGELINGNILRDAVTPLSGTVPRTGALWAQSAKWCRLVAAVFGEPSGFGVQDAFGRERLLKAFKAPRMQGKSVEQVIFGGTDAAGIRHTDIGPELDLATAVWYSNSVNAPAIAIDCLAKLGTTAKAKDFSKCLLRALGTRQYGRWNAADPNGRYQRTRRLAMASNLWPKTLFEGPAAIMPATL